MRFHEIATPDGNLACYRGGEGPPVVFLHGGPGDTHHYLREVAENLQSKFDCILFDQRGTGRSFLRSREKEQLNFKKFIEDIDSILKFFHLEKAHFFGHSWGGILGLLYNIARPQRVDRNLIVSMGPISEDFGRIYNENLLKAFSPEEQGVWKDLRSKRRLALDQGDAVSTAFFENKMMYLRAKSWVHHPDLRESFLQGYFRDPPVDRHVNGLVWESFSETSFDNLSFVKSPVLFVHGQEDATPMEQIDNIAKRIPSADIYKVPECGHLPWLDQKQEFFERVLKFLS